MLEIKGWTDLESLQFGLSYDNEWLICHDAIVAKATVNDANGVAYYACVGDVANKKNKHVAILCIVTDSVYHKETDKSYVTIQIINSKGDRVVDIDAELGDFDTSSSDAFVHSVSTIIHTKG